MEQTPIAVLISDIHYNERTLELADKATRLAIEMANELDVPLIVAGDLHDSKAAMRGECINAMLKTFKLCKHRPIILIGNHDRLNEKNAETGLNFLEPIADIIKLVYDCDGKLVVKSYSKVINGKHLTFIPYYNDVGELRDCLKTLPHSSTIIMHQGITGANSGEYIQDKSALNPEDVQDFRVISGHYHRRQDIKTGRPQKGARGLWSFIGNPYTLNFAEADDPEKGFQVLMDDGTMEFVATDLRRHHVIELSVSSILNEFDVSGKNETWNEDLFWVKIRGSSKELNRCTKEQVAKVLGIKQSFKLDLIQRDVETEVTKKPNMTQEELLDSLIDSMTNTEDDTKAAVKELWKGLV